MPDTQTISEILRDPKKSQDDKNEAIAQLAELMEPPGEPQPERPHAGFGAYAASGDEMSGALDKASKEMDTNGWDGAKAALKENYPELKKAIMDVVKGSAGPLTVGVNINETQEGDEGPPWNFSVSTQEGASNE